VIEYTTYYDASGTQDSEAGAIAVLGIVSKVTRWLRFEKEWNAVLDPK